MFLEADQTVVHILV